MPDERPTISTSRVNASGVVRRSFATVRRGFDPQEVRSYLDLVARELQAWEQREQDMQAQLTAALEKARHPVLDEATLTAALGQQSAQILRSAHEEAARLTERAEETAASLVREAHQQATDVQIRAESSAAERTAAAELAAASIAQKARDDAAHVLEVARVESEQLVAEAREQGRAMLEQAQEASKRVLAEAAARRQAVHSQIEQLRAARDELAATVSGVRGAVDQILEGLAEADDNARAAAAAVASVLPRLPSPEAPVPVQASGSEEAAGDLSAERAPAPSDPPSADRPERREPAPPAPTEPADQGPGADVVILGAHRAGSKKGAPGGSTGARPGAAPHERSEASGDRETTPDPDDGPRGLRGELPDGPEEGADPTREESPSGTTTSEGGEGPETAIDPGGLRGPGDEPGPGEGEAEVRSRSVVEELFARIRAGGAGTELPSVEEGAGAGGGDARPEPPEGLAEEAAPAAPATTQGPPPDQNERVTEGSQESPTTEPRSPEDRKRIDGDRSETGTVDADPPDGGVEEIDGRLEGRLEGRSEQAIGSASRALARRLKRAFADDQNRILDRIRVSPGASLDDLVGPEDEHLQGYRDAVRGQLEDAYGAGVALIRELASPAGAPGSRRGSGRVGRTGSGMHQAVGTIVDELAASVVSLLRNRLLGSGEGQPDDARSLVGAAFREWRGERLERLAQDAARGALCEGILAAGEPKVLWVLDPEGGACPDCDDNSLSDPVEPGEAFPTGHRRPPAHPGCRCLLAPTTV